MSPQCRTILNHMRRAGHITNREAMIDHAIMALPKRITELEEQGYVIGREQKNHPVTGQRYFRYWLVKERGSSLYDYPDGVCTGLDMVGG